MPFREVHWEVTNQCNLRCKHCLPASGTPRPNELSTDEALAALAEFCLAGATRISFTGGEPFARSDMLILIREADRLGLQVGVITNGTLLGEATLSLLQKAEVSLAISVDGATPVTNDAVRGNGTYQRAVKALRRCRAYGIDVELFVTVNQRNVHELRQIAELARTHGCSAVHFNEVSVGGRAHTFLKELSLSAADRTNLPSHAASVAREVFGEELSLLDERCWADGSALYMTADGNVYACSEVFQRRPEFTVGNIRSNQLQEWLQAQERFPAHEKSCCYGVLASEHVVLVYNKAQGCALAPLAVSGRKQITTIEDLYEELDLLYTGIERDCFECREPDCIGYIWLLKREARRLYERGVPLVEVNRGPTFIHSFPTGADGQVALNTRYPSCGQLCADGRCSIHKDRPLVCRLYPIGLETTEDGRVVWALHRDCLHVCRLEQRGRLQDLERHARSVIGRLSHRLLSEIVETYRAVDAISAFPEGENNYYVLEDVNIAH